MSDTDDLPATRRRMAVRGFLCQNIAIGCAFGGFGIAILPLQQRYGLSRAEGAMCLSLAVLVMSLAGPLVAAAIARVGLRHTMVLGILVSAAGYCALAAADSATMVMVAYALPVGLGLAMFGHHPACVLASNWFQPHPGKAIGFVNTPLLMMIVPAVGTALIAAGGLRALYVTFVAMHLLLLPVAWGIVDAPAQQGTARHGRIAGAADGLSNRQILRQPVFWLALIAGGTLSATAITTSSHIVALAIEEGIAPAQAALLVSVIGAASIAGSLGLGVLVDRIGPARTLILIAFAFLASWLLIGTMRSYLALAIAVALVGGSAPSVFATINVLVGQRFGNASVARAMGLYSVLTLPMMFGVSPIVGTLRDRTGDYGLAATVLALGCAAALVLCLLVDRLIRSARSRPHMEPAL
jgi:predicted MFS family arabinose efflux permease